MKDTNESNIIRKSNNGMTSSLTSSSSSDGMYDVENNWANLNKFVYLDNAVTCIETKLNSSSNLNYSIIHSDSLASGLADLNRMYNVAFTNPVIFLQISFLDWIAMHRNKPICSSFSKWRKYHDISFVNWHWLFRGT